MLCYAVLRYAVPPVVHEVARVVLRRVRPRPRARGPAARSQRGGRGRGGGSSGRGAILATTVAAFLWVHAPWRACRRDALPYQGRCSRGRAMPRLGRASLRQSPASPAGAGSRGRTVLPWALGAAASARRALPTAVPAEESPGGRAAAARARPPYPAARRRTICNLLTW